MKVRGRGRQRNLEENVLCWSSCFCLGCGLWKVVWSQQAFFGVLRTDREVERPEF